jgi:hypothetical protein
LRSMSNSNKLFVEILEDVLRRLPKKPKLESYELWNAIPNFRRSKRFNAYSFEEGRSARSRRSKEWLDVQKNRSTKTKV